VSNWSVKTAYKYDLANLANLMTGESNYQRLHPEAYAHFRDCFDPSLLSQVRGVFEQGILLGPAISTILAQDDYDGSDLSRILQTVDRASEQPFYQRYREQFPFIRALLMHLHGLGADQYWQEHCLPTLQARCQQLQSDAESYPVVGVVDAMLGAGYRQNGDTVTVYLAHFAAPHGTSLRSLTFLSDQRWGIDVHVATAIHELLHPPFEREEIRRLAPLFSRDPFFQAAKARLPLGSGYPEAADFLEENLVEGVHVYLAEQMGVIKDPLGYFVRHDNATHVVSAVVYHALKQGLRDQCSNLKETILLMIEQGHLSPGNMREQYDQVYRSAGVEHPW